MLLKTNVKYFWETQNLKIVKKLKNVHYPHLGGGGHWNAMSLKLYLVHSHLDLFLENMGGAACDKHAERFQNDPIQPQLSSIYLILLLQILCYHILRELTLDITLSTRYSQRI